MKRLFTSFILSVARGFFNKKRQIRIFTNKLKPKHTLHKPKIIHNFAQKSENHKIC